MDTEQYLAAFAAMGINPRSKSAAELIGMSHRMTIYYADGAFIPLPIQKLVVLLLDRFNHGEPLWPQNTTQSEPNQSTPMTNQPAESQPATPKPPQ